LLAIHSAISLSDAIKVALTGARGKFQDHRQSASELKRLCSAHSISHSGIGHLTWLLSQKNSVAYEEARLDDNAIRQVMAHAERFNTWAYNSFKGILRGN
jgi:hypothetical protein